MYAIRSYYVAVGIEIADFAKREHAGLAVRGLGLLDIVVISYNFV